MDKSVILIQAQTKWFDNSRDETRMTNLNQAFLRIAHLFKNAGIDCSILDFNNINTGIKTIAGHLTNRNISLALISLDIKAVDSACAITEYIKGINPDVKIMWSSMGMGFLVPFVMLFKETVLNYEIVDYILYGNERDFLFFMEEYFEGKSQFSAHGVGYKHEGALVYNEIYKDNDSEYVPEDYSAVDMEEYIWRWGREFLAPVYVKKQRIIPVSTGVGCAYSCTFCINSNSQWKKNFKTKSTDLLLFQLKFLVNTYHPDVIWFQDDNFFIDKQRAQAALDFLNREKIKWAGQGRLNYFRDDYINEEFFRKYIAPGALWFGVGFETFSDSLRSSLNKHVTREQLEEAARLCDKYDVPFNPAFIFGVIEQTNTELKNDVLQLLDFHKRYPKTTFSYQLWRPYPGTAEFEKLQKKGLSIPFPDTINKWLHYKGFDDYDNIWWLNDDVRALIPYNHFLISRYCNVSGVFGKTIIDRLLYPILRKEFIEEKFYLSKLYKLLYRIKKKFS